jgi:hypothetical protein
VAAPRAPALAEFRYQEGTQPGNLGAQEITDNEEIFVNFNVPVARMGNSNSTEHVEVFFSEDIDNNGSIGGTSFGEVGNNSGRGFPLTIKEPLGPYVTRSTQPELPVFPIFTSSYSTRYSFVYSPARVGVTTLRPLNPSTTSMVVAFSRLPFRTTDTYETIWGQPITGDISATGVAQQPPATP